MPYTDYTYSGSVWANASPQKVWLLLNNTEWPVPAKFEVSQERIEADSRHPSQYYWRYVVDIGSDDRGGWITPSQLDWLRGLIYSPIRLQTNLFRGNRLDPSDPLQDDGWASGIIVFIRPPIRAWPVDWGGQYFQYSVSLVSPIVCPS